jgi:hypothetical protein
LIVNYQNPVGAYGDANVSAGTLKHINIAGDLDDFDFDFGKILGVRGFNAEAKDEDCQY